MELMHPAIPPLAILLGAGTLTLAQYRATPLIWRISNQYDRYGLLVFACGLGLSYVAILPDGPVAQIIAVPTQLLNVIGIVLVGLGAGFAVVGAMLLFRRNEKASPRRHRSL
jgi:hypothetical protein